MSSQETKRQHYVPKTYLNKFAQETKKQHQIHCIQKDDLKRIFPIGTHNICVKTDMYTLDGETEDERQILEKFYGDTFEANYNEIYTLITDDSIDTVNSKTREQIIGFVITLLFRTRKLQVIHNRLVEKVIERALELARNNNKNQIKFEGGVIEINGRNASEIASDLNKKDRIAQNLTQLKLAMRLIDVRRNDFVCVVKVDSQYGFLTSDHPVTLYNPNTEILAPFSKDNLLSLPINSKYRIDILPNEKSLINNKIARVLHSDMMAKGEVAINNRGQFLNCDEFILGDKKDLELIEFQMFNQKFANQIKHAQIEAFKKLKYL